MDVKELYRVKAIQQRLAALKDRQDVVNGLVDSVQAIDYSKDKVQCSFQRDTTFVKVFQQKEQIERLIEQETLSMVLAASELIEKIDLIQNPKLRKVLYCRYVKLGTMAQVSCDLELTYRYTQYLHNKAVEAWKELP